MSLICFFNCHSLSFTAYNSLWTSKYSLWILINFLSGDNFSSYTSTLSSSSPCSSLFISFLVFAMSLCTFLNCSFPILRRWISFYISGTTFVFYTALFLERFRVISLVKLTLIAFYVTFNTLSEWFSMDIYENASPALSRNEFRVTISF